MGLGEIYNYLFVELSLSYTREWPLIPSPLPLMLIILGYLYFVLYAGPRYMKDRPPYDLKTFILFYNVIEILANIWFVKEHISAGWFKEFSLVFVTCRARNAMGLDPIKIFNMIWWLMFLKLFDFVETCVFVLRKKQNQVSALHVYHHISNVIFTWHYLKYILDERLTIVTLINCAVHIIMYIYYFMAAWSPRLQQTLFPIKPYITKLQMVQFIFLVVILSNGFLDATLSFNCEIGSTILRIAPIFIGNLFIFLYLFYNFYKKSYTKKLHKKKSN
ncbi:elongation of very long chain fatty acids protein [Monomorium pharaonis]|uniref:elongation of very long chain fatty acids protein n=1 Tax=Monomorium pharaonis TaxID=307658 RepID=UPI00102E1FA0|nr:elongation of very long chain fatty acids protein [Monomorium pharaonis]